jgi:predicted DNA-binding transcriptional regulator AlpA
MDRLITKQQAGALLGLHPESVMRLARQGRFPSPLKLGAGVRGRVRFSQEQIRAWLEALQLRQQARPRVEIVDTFRDD